MPAALPISMIIAGGGPVGLATAGLLAAGPAASRVKLQVIDAGELPIWQSDRMDLRVYALSRTSQRVLERADAWEWMRERRVSPYRQMRVWQGDQPQATGSVLFDSAEIAEPDLGHIVEDRLIREALIRALKTARNVQISSRTQIESLRRQGDSIHVTLTNGQSMRASLLVAADGANSPIRESVGIATISRGYGQHALVTHVKTSKPHRQTAWQRFLPSGPLALLPLADGRSSVVWSLPDSQARELYECSDRDLCEALHDASAGALGECMEVSDRALFPLRARHATRYSEERVVLAGDAAHTVHPLAGQGMNLGLLDAAALVAVVEKAVHNGEDPGDQRALKRYERIRKADNLGMLLAFDALDRLYRLPAWFRPISATGIAAVDCVTPVKQFLMKRALGLDKSARGIGAYAE